MRMQPKLNCIQYVLQNVQNLIINHHINENSFADFTGSSRKNIRMSDSNGKRKTE